MLSSRAMWDRSAWAVCRCASRGAPFEGALGACAAFLMLRRVAPELPSPARRTSCQATTCTIPKLQSSIVPLYSTYTGGH